MTGDICKSCDNYPPPPTRPLTKHLDPCPIQSLSRVGGPAGHSHFISSVKEAPTPLTMEQSRREWRHSGAIFWAILILEGRCTRDDERARETIRTLSAPPPPIGPFLCGIFYCVWTTDMYECCKYKQFASKPKYNQSRRAFSSAKPLILQNCCS